jgi:RecJ-like exonuclease
MSEMCFDDFDYDRQSSNCDCEECKPELENIEDYPPHMLGDYITKNKNIKNGKDLCNRCDGTGNEFYSMYKKCSACGGTGIFNENFDYEKDA